jgi:halogenation protein CepH
MKFDSILLSRARLESVDVRERHQVCDLAYDGHGRVTGVHYIDDRGQPSSAYARYVVDAGGHRDSLHRHCGQRVYSRFFLNVALYAYFENGKRLPAPNGGNILSVAFSDGWFWYIPLSETLTSVGAVVSQDAAACVQSGPADAMERFINRAPMIKEFLAGARRATLSPYDEYRVRTDYSYCSTRFWRPGLALIGDAACFVDPVFSSGVHLATYSALLAARSINTCLRGDISEEVCFDEFERRYRREFGNFYQFLVGFYDMHVDTSSYFWRARKIVATDERDNVAFVRLVAGLSAVDEPLFGSGQEFFESRVGFGSWFEQALQGGAAGMPVASAVASTFDRSRFDPDVFRLGFTSEIEQIQSQALLAERRGVEKPLFPSNLIPSADGLHWRIQQP